MTQCTDIFPRRGEVSVFMSRPIEQSKQDTLERIHTEGEDPPKWNKRLFLSNEDDDDDDISVNAMDDDIDWVEDDDGNN